MGGGRYRTSIIEAMGTKLKTDRSGALWAVGIGTLVAFALVGWPRDESSTTHTFSTRIAQHQSSGYIQSERFELVAGLREHVNSAPDELQKPFRNLMNSVPTSASTWERSANDVITACMTSAGSRT